MTEPLRIAIAGLGTVGAGVVAMLQTNGALIAARAGRPIEIAAISARSRRRDRGVDLSPYAWEDDPVALARRPDVDLVVEAIGGEDGPAKATAETAIAGGRHVVTANKAMLARHGQALAEAAEARGVALRFEAAVAGGIPILKALAEGLAGNAASRVMGVMNGTCNYILTRMEATGAPYAEALAEAQRLGYAEADPAFDVGGVDAAQKLALLAAIAFGTQVDFPGVAVEGIERVSIADIEQAADMGYRIKLLCVARLTEAGLEARTQPCLVPARSPLGTLEGVTNMVVVEGDFIGRTIYTGPGAGAGPTASAIVGDIVDVARGAVRPAFGVPAALLAAPRRAGDGAEAAFYLRLALTDAPGVLARVAAALGDEGVSINRMRQYEHATEEAPVIIVTHRTRRAALDAALARIASLDVCGSAPVALRIEEV
ncbi:homoserine dehydrogenase [Amaricoccus sp.]|uniref:homoserine dehydrogenase n=1 Tax=Amaricoccus sp. TaxID=1872485 RepID=UPI001B527117|nr:homoserine dehydrogenase [Amaricoccus sp.]MBP6999947.1 homoserine dehydrogenase [Amaricoccus sp.]